MKRTYYPDNLLSALTFIILIVSAFLNGQALTIKNITQHPVEYSFKGFEPENIWVSNNLDIFLIDRESSQISSIGKNTNYLGGGRGAGQGSLFDAIDLASFFPDVFVADRSANKIIKFDNRLNFKNEIIMEEIYPGKIIIDDWGKLLIWDERTNYIHSMNINSYTIDLFIDLNNIGINNASIMDWHFAENGDLGILLQDTNEFLLFNRLGRLILQLPTQKGDWNFTLNYQGDWYIADQGHIMNVKTRKKFKLPDKENILDLTSRSNKLYILTEKSIVHCTTGE